jgi:hypothetical protein
MLTHGPQVQAELQYQGIGALAEANGCAVATRGETAQASGAPKAKTKQAPGGAKACSRCGAGTEGMYGMRCVCDDKPVSTEVNSSSAEAAGCAIAAREELQLRREGQPKLDQPGKDAARRGAVVATEGQPWPALTLKQAECKLCLKKGRGVFCHHHGGRRQP